MKYHPNFSFGFGENILGKEKEICAEYKYMDIRVSV
jgi:hypothetical protein